VDGTSNVDREVVVLSGFTPGPWEWYGSLTDKSVRLQSKVGMRMIVMGFTRWGMQSGQPRFCEDGLLKSVDKFFKPRAEHHPNFDLDVDHPDANLIAAAPDMYGALKKAEFAIMQVPAMSEGVASLLEKAASSIEKALRKAEGGTQ